MAHPFPPDLWGYVHGFGHHPKGSVVPLRHYNPLKLVWSKCRTLKFLLPAILIVTFFICRCWSTTTRKGRVYKIYESLTSVVTIPDSSTQPSLTLPSFTMWTPPSPPSKLRHTSTTPSALQAITARGSRGRVVISYWRYKYNGNLSEGLPVIEDTSTITTWVKGCQSSTIRVRIWPVWSMTCVVDDLWSMAGVVDDLCDRWPVVNDRCGQWPVWLMTYVVDDRCGRHLTLCATGRDED